jgi:hypothetical protein
MPPILTHSGRRKPGIECPETNEFPAEPASAKRTGQIRSGKEQVSALLASSSVSACRRPIGRTAKEWPKPSNGDWFDRRERAKPPLDDLGNG